MSDYPEHDKLRVIKHESQTVGEFIEWLSSNGYHICEKRDSQVSVADLDRLKPTGRTRDRMGDAFAMMIDAVMDSATVYWPTIKRLPDKLLSEYFQIDQNKLEREKLAMLEVLRQPR